MGVIKLLLKVFFGRKGKSFGEEIHRGEEEEKAIELEEKQEETEEAKEIAIEEKERKEEKALEELENFLSSIITQQK